ncbi:TetR/AcrR family transcriptional regulator [Terrisporobacter sp.]
MEKEILIIKEAKKLFIKKGITSTSIDDIAKVCKISKATFYKYFKNKEDIIIEILKYSQSKLEDKCKNIDCNFDIDDKEKLRQKIITIWDYRSSDYDFRIYIARECAKGDKEEIDKLQKMNRHITIDEYKKSLILNYGNNINNIIWDIIFIIDSLVLEFIMLTRINKQIFEPDIVGDFILNIIENTVNTLDDKKVFMSEDIISGLESFDNKLTYEDYEKYFYQRLKETKNLIKSNTNLDNKVKLMKAIEEIENQANNNAYNSLTMDAMLAFIATEKSLSNKVDSLNRIRHKLGDFDNEK